MRALILVEMAMVTMLAAGAGTPMAEAAGKSCESLRTVNVADMTVTLAESVAAGAETRYPKLPAFCRVAATLRPTSDSEIKIEVWMPDAAAWNGKFQGTGNGGCGGSIQSGEMGTALERGYASASTGTGHRSGERRGGEECRSRWSP